ncbi:putative RiPP precursor [Prauserella sp. PE36]|uniref:Lasso RiPP family leader peptide-containing protein n=1 Tax=Prauserella endophytica TaxID=1592324 RepID=A0ABY2SDN4_9PSEU|nr:MULTISPECIES: lasso RiPP family leader peptide-containing protein [Prauserella]RBM21302.1 putative RiPP precursor [Prauserella sp. PE36]TKG73712.1 lasso RiPP family leader peptide-containing protein [Prauserella endophytica]
MKEVYTAPALEEIGSVAEITLGQSQGSRLDADFAAGTVFGDLTFS